MCLVLEDTKVALLNLRNTYGTYKPPMQDQAAALFPPDCLEPTVDSRLFMRRFNRVLGCSNDCRFHTYIYIYTVYFASK